MVNNNNFLDNYLKQGFIVVPKLPTADDLVTKPIFHKEAGKKRIFWLWTVHEQFRSTYKMN